MIIKVSTSAESFDVDDKTDSNNKDEDCLNLSISDQNWYVYEVNSILRHVKERCQTKDII